jgi:uncharacterized membrane protein YqjE
MNNKEIIEYTIGIVSPLIGLAVLILDALHPGRAQNITLAGFIILVLLGTILGILLIRFKDKDDAEPPASY